MKRCVRYVEWGFIRLNLTGSVDSLLGLELIDSQSKKKIVRFPFTMSEFYKLLMFLETSKIKLFCKVLAKTHLER